MVATLGNLGVVFSALTSLPAQEEVEEVQEKLKHAEQEQQRSRFSRIVMQFVTPALLEALVLTFIAGLPCLSSWAVLVYVQARLQLIPGSNCDCVLLVLYLQVSRRVVSLNSPHSSESLSSESGFVQYLPETKSAACMMLCISHYLNETALSKARRQTS